MIPQTPVAEPACTPSCPVACLAAGNCQQQGVLGLQQALAADVLHDPLVQRRQLLGKAGLAPAACTARFLCLSCTCCAAWPWSCGMQSDVLMQQRCMGPVGRGCFCGAAAPANLQWPHCLCRGALQALHRAGIETRMQQPCEHWLAQRLASAAAHLAMSCLTKGVDHVCFIIL